MNGNAQSTSRFHTNAYPQVLENPRERYRIRRKEKSLWKRKISSVEKLVITFFLLFLVLSFTMLVLLPSNSPLPFAFLVAICLILFVVILPIAAIRREKMRKANLKNRKPQNIRDFIYDSPTLQNCYKPHVRAVRYALGFVHGLNPDMIYPDDTAHSIGYLLRDPRPPLRFEVILGTANRLGITLLDEDVDRIGKRIYKEARTVENLIAILSEEMKSVERQQTISITTVDSVLSSANQTTATARRHESVIGFCKFVVIITLLAVSIEFSAEHDKGTDVFSEAMGQAVLKAAVIGFAVGTALWLTGLFLKKKLSVSAKKTSGKDNEINLDELRELADDSPAKKYINRWITELAKSPQTQLKLAESEPLPKPTGMTTEEMPSFAEVLTKLLSKLKMDARQRQTPAHKVQEMSICLTGPEQQNFDVHYEICDGAEEAFIIL